MRGRALPGACRSLCSQLKSQTLHGSSLASLQCPAGSSAAPECPSASSALSRFHAQPCRGPAGCTFHHPPGLPQRSSSCTHLCHSSLGSSFRSFTSQSAFAAAASASNAATRASGAAEATVDIDDEVEPELTEEQQAGLDRLASSIASESEDFDENDWFTEEREAEQEGPAEEKLSSKAERKKRSWSDRFQSVREVPFEALPKVGCQHSGMNSWHRQADRHRRQARSWVSRSMGIRT